MIWNFHEHCCPAVPWVWAQAGDCEIKAVQSLTGLRQDNVGSSLPVVQFKSDSFYFESNDMPFHSIIGDPTLHLHYLAPPVSASKNSTNVTWSASSDPAVTQYVVSYKDTNGFIVRAAANASSFASCCSLNLTPTEAASGFIIVRSAKVVTSGNGSYWALSAGRIAL